MDYNCCCVLVEERVYGVWYQLCYCYLPTTYVWGTYASLYVHSLLEHGISQ